MVPYQHTMRSYSSGLMLTPSTVTGGAHRGSLRPGPGERVAWKREIEHEKLEVGATAERVEIGIFTHQADVPVSH